MSGIAKLMPEVPEFASLLDAAIVKKVAQQSVIHEKIKKESIIHDNDYRVDRLHQKLDEVDSMLNQLYTIRTLVAHYYNFFISKKYKEVRLTAKMITVLVEELGLINITLP